MSPTPDVVDRLRDDPAPVTILDQGATAPLSVMLPNTRRFPSMRPSGRDGGAQMYDLDDRVNPWLVRSMGGFIELGADGDRYSECWFATIPFTRCRRRQKCLSERALHVERAAIA